jgi:hypothetical protein
VPKPRSARRRDNSVTAYLTHDEVTQLDVVAKQQDLSRSAAVRELLREGLDRHGFSTVSGSGRVVNSRAEAVGASQSAQRTDLTNCEWFAIQLAWYPYAISDRVWRARSTWTTAGPDVVTTSSGVAGLLAMLGISGLTATLVGAYVALLYITARQGG